MGKESKDSSEQSTGALARTHFRESLLSHLHKDCLLRPGPRIQHKEQRAGQNMHIFLWRSQVWFQAPIVANNVYNSSSGNTTLLLNYVGFCIHVMYIQTLKDT